MSAKEIERIVGVLVSDDNVVDDDSSCATMPLSNVTAAKREEMENQLKKDTEIEAMMKAGGKAAADFSLALTDKGSRLIVIGRIQNLGENTEEKKVPKLKSRLIRDVKDTFEEVDEFSHGTHNDGSTATVEDTVQMEERNNTSRSHGENIKTKGKKLIEILSKCPNDSNNWDLFAQAFQEEYDRLAPAPIPEIQAAGSNDGQRSALTMESA